MPDNPALAAFKPNYAEAVQRWQAFYAGEIIDRPAVCVLAPKEGYPPAQPLTYHDKAFGDPQAIIERVLANIEATYWGGEAFPTFYPSVGPDEISVFTGAELRWSPDSRETNWSVPFVEDWEEALPLRLNLEHPLWQRQQALYRLAAERFAGRILLVPPDLHTNMDLLAGIRGPQRLCLDLLDCPELIDRAMQDSRAIFRQVWEAVSQAGQMSRYGYCTESHGIYSYEGAAFLQCDFSIMISPKAFRRWVLPALEEEAAIVKHVVYHWDGFGALVHAPDILACPGLQTLSFVPGDGHGDPADHLDLLKRLQAGGKSLHVWGTPEQCQRMHKELRPEKVYYCTQTATPEEAEKLLEWFVRNT